MAKLLRASASYKRTINMEKYENGVVEASMAVEFEPDDNVAEVMGDLWATVKENVMAQAYPLMKVAAKRNNKELKDAEFFVGLFGTSIHTGGQSIQETAAEIGGVVVDVGKDDGIEVDGVHVGKYWITKIEGRTNFGLEQLVEHSDDLEELRAYRDTLDFQTDLCAVAYYDTEGWLPSEWIEFYPTDESTPWDDSPADAASDTATENL